MTPPAVGLFRAGVFPSITGDFLPVFTVIKTAEMTLFLTAEVTWGGLVLLRRVDP